MKIDPAKVIQLVEEGEKKVDTRSLDISLNELADMIDQGELQIDPNYQRLFQWDEGTRSRFIESLLLELPVPPIYAVEEESGTYQLVDGLQRISSYLHFRGQLEAPQFDPPVTKGQALVLEGCDMVPELNGITYADLPVNLQIRVRRKALRMEIIKKSSDKLIKYHMFKRLNSEGKPLSDQQKRNSSLRMLDDQFVDYITTMSSDQNFSSTISPISDDKILSWYNRELVLRFFAMKNKRSEFKHDVKNFLDSYAEEIAVGDAARRTDETLSPIFDYEKETRVFKDTFSLIKDALDDKAFGYTTKRNAEPTGFSVLQFEAITLGLQKHLYRLLQIPEGRGVEILKEALIESKSNPEYMKMTTGGGKNSSGPFRDRIEFIERAIESKLNDRLQN